MIPKLLFTLTPLMLALKFFTLVFYTPLHSQHTINSLWFYLFPDPSATREGMAPFVSRWIPETHIF